MVNTDAKQAIPHRCPVIDDLTADLDADSVGQELCSKVSKVTLTYDTTYLFVIR
ncbi:hypothetical protein BRE01_07500 [Brevibacillus reuszeri]|uniref:Uncharacterized protein n=1 Tax=Brevibacillus reuszeri TaxID=54915 RepID=A0ABQ0TGL9_9BACL|nr:hypothetical protein BRE01_07500 [Brevibacillus reuszeri]